MVLEDVFIELYFTKLLCKSFTEGFDNVGVLVGDRAVITSHRVKLGSMLVCLSRVALVDLLFDDEVSLPRLAFLEGIQERGSTQLHSLH